jgi:hypothetical protein
MNGYSCGCDVWPHWRDAPGCKSPGPAPRRWPCLPRPRPPRSFPLPSTPRIAAETRPAPLDGAFGPIMEASP